jgi:two-component system, probable response regulator PhcQ
MTADVTTILCVDDEPEVLESLRRTLRREPYRLLTATSAAEAFDIVAIERVDVIVSDIDMPGTNGLELVARIRRDQPAIVRVLLTGDASLEAALDAINQGEVHRFLTKPWDKDQLRRTLHEAVARLGELRRAAAAAAAASIRDQLLESLERSHPGITRIQRIDGVYAVDIARLRAWSRGIADPLVCLVFGIADDPDDPLQTRRART